MENSSQKLILKRPTTRDVPQIEKIAEKYEFALPEKFHSAAVVVNKDGEVKAFGIVRYVLEAVIVTDGSTREVIEETDLLIQQGMIDAHNLGFDEIHAFVENPTFARVLKEKFGFQNIAGEGLVIKMRSSNG